MTTTLTQIGSLKKILLQDDKQKQAFSLVFNPILELLFDGSVLYGSQYFLDIKWNKDVFHRMA